MKRSNSHHKELERVGEEYKKLLEEIQIERIKRGIDRNKKSRKRICQGIVKLYKVDPSFKNILINSEMPEEDFKK